MFQSFEVKSQPELGAARIAALRSHFDSWGVDAILQPRGDEFQGEYVPACAERLSWLTGFTGSAGVVLVTRTRAIVFVDGRYVTQLAQQTDPAVFEGGDLIGHPPARFIETNGEALRLGIDPWLHTEAEVRKLEKVLAASGGSLVSLSQNPVDAIWQDRPEPPLGKVFIQDLPLSGKLAAEKLAEAAAGLTRDGLDAMLVTDPSSIAWLFNLRGSDVPHTPHPLARAILYPTGKPDLFLDHRKTGLTEEAYIAQIAHRHDPDALIARLTALSSAGKVIGSDADLAPYALHQRIADAGGVIRSVGDPARLPRATKNMVELNGAAASHLQDGAAMVEFLAWLSEQAPGSLTEIDAARKLEDCRRAVGERLGNPLMDISFDSISATGEHAAIMHYRVTTETDRVLAPGEVYLIDSGAQYRNGTTDITRTLAIGNVGPTERRFFTLVLKGMIAISQARFPKGTRGCDLDPFARQALWQAGADFAHGTGHGVGSYLSVHEGPQRISRAAMQELLPGMILSNEPGYYRPGSFGIRIENLVYVRPAEEIDGGDLPMLGFETLTFCPIDRAMIDVSLLSPGEIDWLNRYHAKTAEMLLPLLSSDDVRHWLTDATKPLSR